MSNIGEVSSALRAFVQASPNLDGASSEFPLAEAEVEGELPGATPDCFAQLWSARRDRALGVIGEGETGAAETFARVGDTFRPWCGRG